MPARLTGTCSGEHCLNAILAHEEENCEVIHEEVFCLGNLEVRELVAPTQ